MYPALHMPPLMTRWNTSRGRDGVNMLVFRPLTRLKVTEVVDSTIVFT